MEGAIADGVAGHQQHRCTQCSPCLGFRLWDVTYVLIVEALKSHAILLRVNPVQVTELQCTWCQRPAVGPTSAGSIQPEG